MQGSRWSVSESSSRWAPPQAREPAPPGIAERSYAEGLVLQEFRAQTGQDAGKEQDLSPSWPPTPQRGPATTCSPSRFSSTALGPQGLSRPPRQAETGHRRTRSSGLKAGDSGPQLAACHPASLTSLLPQAQPRSGCLTWPAPPSRTPGGGDYGERTNGLQTASVCPASSGFGPPLFAFARAQRPRPRPRTAARGWRALLSASLQGPGGRKRGACRWGLWSCTAVGISPRDSRLKELV